MDKDERSEVREMITTTLSAWHDSTVEREKLIYASLNNIDSHLDKLNGKVASHEKTILENLPHGIQHCPQANVIQEIHDKMIEDKGANQQRLKIGTHKQVTFNNVFTIISTILLLAGLVISYLLGKKDDEKLNTKIDNFGTPIIINTRTGQPSQLNPYDSLKFYRDGEFKSTYKDTLNGTNTH